MAGRRVVAVAGTHGKTTTTSLLTSALVAAGADPTYAVGGVLAATGHNAERRRPATSSSPRPTRATAPSSSTGRTPRSSPTWPPTTSTCGGPRRRTARPSRSSRRRSTRTASWCAASTTPAPATSPSASRAAGPRIVTVGEASDADVRATDLAFVGATSRFTVVRGDEVLGTVELRIPGRHYVVDALAALVAGLELGHSFDGSARGPRGVHRLGAADGGEGRRRRRPRLRQLRPPPGRDRGRPRGGARGRGRGPARRRLPAPPGLAHPRVRSGHGGRAGCGRRGRRPRRVRRARGRPTRPSPVRLVADAVPLPADRVAFVAGLDEAAVELVARARRGDLVLTLGAGSITVGRTRGCSRSWRPTGEGARAAYPARPGRAHGPALPQAVHPTAVAPALAGVAVRRGRRSSSSPWSSAARGSSTSPTCSP